MSTALKFIQIIIVANLIALTIHAVVRYVLPWVSRAASYIWSKDWSEHA